MDDDIHENARQTKFSAHWLNNFTTAIYPLEKYFTTQFYVARTMPFRCNASTLVNALTDIWHIKILEKKS